MTVNQRYWYKLWLQYDNNTFYLAPRASISVEEPNDMETLNSVSGCVGCGGVPDRTFKFNLYFDGNCSLASAWVLFNALNNFVNTACNKDLILYRQVQDETALSYKVAGFSLRMIDPQSQYNNINRQHVLTMEVLFNNLTVWPPTGFGVVRVG